MRTVKQLKGRSVSICLHNLSINRRRKYGMWLQSHRNRRTIVLVERSTRSVRWQSDWFTELKTHSQTNWYYNLHNTAGVLGTCYRCCNRICYFCEQSVHYFQSHNSFSREKVQVSVAAIRMRSYRKWRNIYFVVHNRKCLEQYQQQWIKNSHHSLS